MALEVTFIHHIISGNNTWRQIEVKKIEDFKVPHSNLVWTRATIRVVGGRRANPVLEEDIELAKEVVKLIPEGIQTENFVYHRTEQPIQTVPNPKNIEPKFEADSCAYCTGHCAAGECNLNKER